MTDLQPVTASASRLLAPNPGPMTLDGTNTWILREPGGRQCVVVDPGPNHDGHLARIAEAGPVALVLLTHRHPDHAEGAARLHELTGAPVAARDPSYCISADPIADGPAQPAAGVEWLTVLTPGHSSDSVSFFLTADRALLTGDTVLGSGTTVVAHPDGRLADYLDSLRRLRDLAEHEVERLLPGHGPVVADPVGVLDYYLAHRAERLQQVKDAVAAGDQDADAVVRRVYADVDRSVWPAARRSVQAQLDYLREYADG
jgi:glyoxylase-like metal-dependent hydrolase (beta-lactamase superfamily II)